MNGRLGTPEVLLRVKESQKQAFYTLKEEILIHISIHILIPNPSY